MTVDDKDIRALQSGYDRRKFPTIHGFRSITLDEVKQWAKGETKECDHHVPANSCWRRSDVSGLEHKLWNCDCGDYHIPTCQHFICGACDAMTGGPGIYHINLTPSHVWFLSIDGKARQAKVNGKVRTWKRQPNRVEIPLKYGLYEYATFTTEDIESGRLLAKLED